MLMIVFHYLAFSLLIVSVLFFWGLNFVGLPGNWLIILSAAGWIWLGPEAVQSSLKKALLGN